jgi:hypothetical protein
VKAAADHGLPAFEAILRLVNAMVAGKLPHLDAFLDSNLIAVEKAGGRGVRHIAVGEVWVRIAALCAMAACPGASASCLPLQLEVGVRGGTEAAGHALRAALASDPRLQLVRIDYQNAFNTVSRTAVLQAVADRAPELLPFVQWVYSCPSRPWVAGREEGAPAILSTTGVRQGDPMGPLLFALALQQPLEELIAAVPDSHLVAIHDDVTLVAPPEKAAALFHELASRTAPLGLRIAPTKCAVYSPSPTTPAEVAKTLALPHAPEGIVVAGSSIGSRDFVEAFGRDKAAAVSRTVSRLMELPLELQNQHLLLRLSMVPRTTYLLRAGPIDIGAGCMDRAVRDAALCIAKAGADMVGPLFSPTAAEHIGLPLRLGGCGLPVPTSTLGAAARLSSAALRRRLPGRPASAHRRIQPPAGLTGRPLLLQSEGSKQL